MEFFEAVAARRSVRKYTKTPVPESVIREALSAALLAPNSSNLQPWEFYWVRSPEKKTQLVKACFSQQAAATAQELVVAVSRVDTWQRNKDLVLSHYEKAGNVPGIVHKYYKRVVPLAYFQDPFGILGIFKWLAFSLAGLFTPVPRGPIFRSGLFEVVTKTTALACENFMLAIAAQGYGSCPMEGFDACRVKKVLGLGGKARVVMVISVGETDRKGIYGEQMRVDPSLVVHEV